jgi:hypothetical protein
VVPLHGLLQLGSLPIKRRRTRRRTRVADETLSGAMHRARSRRSPAGRQTRTRRDYWQIACHHACVVQLIAVCCHGSNSTCAESICAHCRHGTANMRIIDSRQVRIPETVVQRCDSAVVIDIGYVDVRDVHRSKASTVSTPPGEERIAWTNRQPSEATPPAVAVSHSNPNATSKSKE